MMALIEMDGKRFWIEFSISYKTLVREYVIGCVKVIEKNFDLTYVRIKGIYPYEEIANAIQKSVDFLIKEGYPINKVIETISEIYGLNKDDVAKILN